EAQRRDSQAAIGKEETKGKIPGGNPSLHRPELSRGTAEPEVDEGETQQFCFGAIFPGRPGRVCLNQGCALFTQLPEHAFSPCPPPRRSDDVGCDQSNQGACKRRRMCANQPLTENDQREEHSRKPHHEAEQPAIVLSDTLALVLRLRSREKYS